MLETKDQLETLSDFLGAKMPSQDELSTVQQDDTSFLKSYDDMTQDAFNSVEEASDTLDLKTEETVNSIKSTYKNIKTTISDTIDTSKKVIIIGGVVVVSLAIWNLIGRDIYYMMEKKR